MICSTLLNCDGNTVRFAKVSTRAHLTPVGFSQQSRAARSDVKLLLPVVHNCRGQSSLTLARLYVTRNNTPISRTTRLGQINQMLGYVL